MKLITITISVELPEGANVSMEPTASGHHTGAAVAAPPAAPARATPPVPDAGPAEPAEDAAPTGKRRGRPRKTGGTEAAPPAEAPAAASEPAAPAQPPAGYRTLPPETAAAPAAVDPTDPDAVMASVENLLSNW